MERTTISYPTIFGAFFILFFFSLNGVNAAELVEERFDCTEVYVDYQDDPSLSQEERLRLMDEAFFRSLNRFEYCQSEKEKNKSAGAAGGGTGGGGASGGGAGTGGASGSEGQEGDGEATSVSESVATSTMSGTEVVKEFPPAEDAANNEKASQEDEQRAGDLSRANGTTPDDIPPAKNDDALAAQIRYAAENEPDPEKRRQLWNEYRKYKGLSPK